MSASQHHSEQLMSPHFASHTSTTPAFNNNGIHNGVIPPASSLLYSTPQFSNVYDNSIIIASQGLHSGNYVANYDVNYSYPSFSVNANYRTSPLSTSLPAYDESFKNSAKIKLSSVSPSSAVSSVAVTKSTNDGSARFNNNNNDVKVFIKSEHLNTVSSDTNTSVPVSNANIAKDFSSSNSVATKKSPISFKSSLENKTLSVSQKGQASALLMTNSSVDTITVNSTTVTGSVYPTSISNANCNNINTTNDVLNGIASCNILTTPLDSNSLNNFYPSPYVPAGFTPEHLLGNNNSLTSTVASTMPPSYCWPTSHSSHTYNQMAGLHGYNGLTDDIYSSTAAIPSSGIGSQPQSQLQYDNELANSGSVASSAVPPSATYGNGNWASSYYLPSASKISDVEASACRTSQLNPYMNIGVDQTFYASQHTLQQSTHLESFSSTAATDTPNALPVGGTTLLCNSSVCNNSNSILPLDTQTSNLYGNFQSHHAQPSHLHNNSTSTTTDSHFLNLISSQQQQPQISELNIYQQQQQDLLSQQIQSQVYNNLPISDSVPFLSTTNLPSSSTLGTKSAANSLISSTKNTSVTKHNKTVRRGRSTTKKNSVTLTASENVGLSLQQQQQQQSTYGNFDSEITGGRSSSISNYSRSLSPNTSNFASKVLRKSRSRTKDIEDDDGLSIEDKEAERRTANNTRERIRVRDINMAFKELAKLCSMHMPNTEERGLTKLGTLLRAVDLIPMLEEQVRQRNLDPKVACLRRNQNIETSQL